MSHVIGGILGGGSSGGSSPFHPYSPTGLSNADQLFQQLFSQEAGALSGPGSPGSSVMSTLNPAHDWMNNWFAQYGPPTLTAAAQAGGYYGNMASQADQFHNLMVDQANQNVNFESALGGAGQSIWNTALDPQSALKQSLQQQVTDASRAATSARGIGMSPEAAGIENQATTNFLMDWENQQLGRQATGLQGMTQAFRGAGEQGQAYDAGLTGAQQMSSLAPQLLMQGAMSPLMQGLNLFGLGTQNAAQYLDTANLAQSGPAGIMSQLIPYMNYGTGAQANAFNASGANLMGLSNLLSGGAGGMFGQAANAGAGGAGSGIMGALSSLFGDAFSGSSLFGDFLLSMGGI